MGRLVRSDAWWWNFLIRRKFIRGEIALGYGKHELNIELPEHCQITKLYLAIESLGMPVCVGALDSVGATVLSDNSFTIYADIKHNHSTVEYAVLTEYKKELSIQDIKPKGLKPLDEEEESLAVGKYKNSIHDVKVTIKECK